MFLHQGHCVSLFVVKKKFIRVLPDYGKIQLQRILGCLAEAKVESDDSHDSIHYLPLDKISRKSLVIVVSPMDTNDLSFYRRLRAFGFQVLLVCPDTLDFVSKTMGNEKGTLLALRAGMLERRLNLNLISQLFVSVIDWKTREPLLPKIRNALRRPMKIRKM